jgi:hypothetical protein
MNAPSVQTNDPPLPLKLLTDDQEARLAAIWDMLGPGPDFRRTELQDEVKKLCNELDDTQYNLFRTWVGPQEGKEYDAMNAKQKALVTIERLLSKIFQACRLVAKGKILLKQVRERGDPVKEEVDKIKGRYLAVLEIFFAPISENPSSFNLTGASTRDDSILTVRTGNSSRTRSHSF